MKYILVQWPESQMIMEQPWLYECFIAQSMDESQDWVGSAAYFVPEERILQMEKTFTSVEGA